MFLVFRIAMTWAVARVAWEDRGRRASATAQSCLIFKRNNSARPPIARANIPRMSLRDILLIIRRSIIRGNSNSNSNSNSRDLRTDSCNSNSNSRFVNSYVINNDRSRTFYILAYPGTSGFRGVRIRDKPRHNISAL